MTPEQVAAGLSDPQAWVLLSMTEDWQEANVARCSVVWAPGVCAAALVKKGLLDYRSDPDVWGRGQYRLNSNGLAVREILKSQESKS